MTVAARATKWSCPMTHIHRRGPIYHERLLNTFASRILGLRYWMAESRADADSCQSGLKLQD